jgi:hypothetical protein
MQKISLIVRSSLDTLKGVNPIGTSMAISLGEFLLFCKHFFKPFIDKNWSQYVDTNISDLHFQGVPLFFAFIFNLPYMFKSYKQEFSKDIEEVLMVLKKGKENKMSDKNMRIIYRELCEKILSKNYELTKLKEEREGFRKEFEKYDNLIK